ncbi:DMT family transporter [Salidesulfovibrio onnuriiensis]|uniref:DMT family transporter n=1 Tax=Salidesulfovibrio onnuriiensis TaxID=2583823 RepID=UPI0011C77101|nr:DMT family transporter [Salidesulfovibrio onnuriiensis]
MTNRSKALTYGLCTVLIWSTVATAFKIALKHLDPLQLLLCANVVSIGALFAILAAQGKLRTLRMPNREILRAAILGVLNPFLYYAVLFKAYALLPAQEAQPINFTWAITLSLLSVPLLGQRLSLREFIAILVSYLGVLTISTHGELTGLHFSSMSGVALALASTIIWALYWIYNTRSKGDPVAGLLLNFLFGLPCVLAATLIFSELPSLTWRAALGASYVGIFEMGVSFALWLTALKYAAGPDGGGTARVANLIFLAPFLSLVFIHFIVGEEIRLSTIAGLAFIIAGNALMQTASRKR